MSGTLETRTIRERAPKSKAFIADIAIHLDVIYLVGGTYHEPTILASSDAVNFHKKKTPDTPGLRSIIALPDDRLFVCGEYGALHYSMNLGEEWQPVETNTKACLYAIERDASGDMWVTGDDGVGGKRAPRTTGSGGRKRRTVAPTKRRSRS